MRVLLRICKTFFMLSLSSLFSILLNGDIVGIEKSHGTCLPTLVVDIFSELFLHPSMFFIKHSRPV